MTKIWALMLVFLLVFAAVADASKPEVPGANIKVSVVDPAGQSVREGIVHISARFPAPWQEYDYIDDRPLPPDGVVYLHPGPGGNDPTITIIVEDNNWMLSDSLEFTMGIYKTLLEHAKDGAGYVIAHRFRLGSREKTVLDPSAPIEKEAE